MTQQEWLIDNAIAPDRVAIDQMEFELGFNTRGLRESASQPQALNLAVRLQDIIWYEIIQEQI
jgi:hypothetical protein